MTRSQLHSAPPVPHPRAAEDVAAVAACAAGDQRGVEQLYRRHAGSCLRLARSVLVDPQHAEDAVQEAFLDLWRQAGRFDGRRSTVRSWLLLLTHRKAVDRVRREQRRRTDPLAPEHDTPDEQPGPEARALLSSLADQTRTALDTLSPAKREVMLLAYWGGFTQSEIAHLTATPLGTVKTRMRSALTDLGSAFTASPLATG